MSTFDRGTVGLVVSVQGRYRTFSLPANSLSEAKVPIGAGQFGPRKFRSLELSLPGIFVSWNFQTGGQWVLPSRTSRPTFSESHPSSHPKSVMRWSVAMSDMLLVSSDVKDLSQAFHVKRQQKVLYRARILHQDVQTPRCSSTTCGRNPQFHLYVAETPAMSLDTLTSNRLFT